MNLRGAHWIISSMLLLPGAAYSQEASSAFSLPVTVSGEGRYSGSAGDGYRVTGGFRALLSPTLQLGSHWFAYSSLGAESEDYLPYATGADTGRPVNFTVLQAYAGYRTEFKTARLLVKAGRLETAFGHFPLEYDDAKTPLIDLPAIYRANALVRPDQIPCNLQDVLNQQYDGLIQFGCGGSTAARYGTVPVTLYGLPGAETQLSWNRFDARAQLTNSSPANPQSLLSRSQFAQWAAGAGYSLPSGLHVGISGFRGPYLDRVVAPLIPAKSALTDFTAAGLGLDAQWFGGPWSLEGEWQRVRLGVPGFVRSPSVAGGYVQAKYIVSPRIFVAFRTNWVRPGGATDSFGHGAGQTDAHQETEELAFGYRISRFQLLKAEFTFLERNGWALSGEDFPAEQHYGFELQLVTSFNPVSRGFR
jgi:hypothetical protein